MRLEIDMIPIDKKLAVLVAQEKCHEGGFSDARLERFLRCEDMNVKVRMKSVRVLLFIMRCFFSGFHAESCGGQRNVMSPLFFKRSPWRFRERCAVVGNSGHLP
jgi:hypothetical protein